MQKYPNIRLRDKGRIASVTFANEIADAVNGLAPVLQLGQPQDPGRFRFGEGLVYVANNSGADRNRFEVLGISDVVIRPTTDLSAFIERTPLTGVSPTSSHAGKFVILAEAIKSGQAGMAFAFGVCPVHVNMASASDTQADVSPGDVTQLKSGSGPATILWAEGGTGTKWAIVRIGGGGGGGVQSWWKKGETGASEASDKTPTLNIPTTNGSATVLKLQSRAGNDGADLILQPASAEHQTIVYTSATGWQADYPKGHD